MDFLGSVNVFHGRVQSGFASVGDLQIPFPDYEHHEPQPPQFSFARMSWTSTARRMASNRLPPVWCVSIAADR
jgi:hypothetical protein